MNAYNIGDFVYLRNYTRTVGKCPKLQAKYKGPHVVVRKFSEWLYEVKCSPSASRTAVVHHDRMRPYLPPVSPKFKQYAEKLKQAA